MKKATIIRNARRVGKNSMSYNDKHRSGPVVYGKISAALKKAKGYIKWIDFFGSAKRLR